MSHGITLAHAFVRINADMKGMFGQVFTEASAAGTAGGRAASDKFGAAMKKGVGHAASIVSVAGVAVVGAGVKMAADFQMQMTRLVTSAGESHKNLALVSRGIMAISISTATSTSELAKGMYTVESAGYHGAKGLTILKAAAQGARAEQAPLKEVTDAVTTALRDYQLPASKAAAVTSAMVAAVGHGKTTFGEFAGSLSTVQATAAKAHISIADLYGALATLTVHGVSAREAAHQLAFTINALQAPNNVAINQMQQLGINSNDVATKLGRRGVAGTIEYLSNVVLHKMGPSGLVLLNAFNKSKAAAADANVMFQKLSPSAQALATQFVHGQISLTGFRKQAKALPGPMAALALQWLAMNVKAKGFSAALRSGTPQAKTYNKLMKDMLGGSLGLRTALQLSAGGFSEVKKNTAAVSKAMRGGKKDVKGFADVQKTLKFQWDKLKQILSVLLIQIGQKLLPAFTHLLTFLANHTWIVKTMGAAFALIFAAGAAYKLNAMASAVGNVIKSLVKLVPALRAAAAGQAALDVAQDASPMGAVILIIEALIGLIVLLVTYWGPISKFFVASWHWIYQAVLPVTNLLRGPFWTVVHAIGAFFSGPFMAALRPVGRFFAGPVFNYFRTTWNSVGKPIFNALRTAAVATWNALRQGPHFAAIAFRGMWAVMRAIWHTVGVPVWTGMKALAHGWYVVMRGSFNLVRIGFRAMWGAMRIAWNAIAVPIWHGMRTAARLWYTVVRGYFHFVALGFRIMWGAMRAAWNAIAIPIWNGMKTAARLWYTVVRGYFHFMWIAFRAMWGAMRAAWNAVGHAIFISVRVAATGMWHALHSLWGFIRGAWSGLWNGVKNAWYKVGHAVMNNVGSNARNVWNLLHGMWNKVRQFWSFLWNGVKNAWYKVGHAVMNNVGANARNVWGLLHTMWGKVRGFWSAIWNSIKNIWYKVGHAVMNNVGANARNVWGLLHQMWGKVRGFWSAIWNSIKNIWNRVGHAVMNAVGGNARNVWNRLHDMWNRIRNFWHTCMNSIRSAWTHIGKPLFDWVGRTSVGLKNRMIDSFRGAMNGIRRIWGGIRGIVARPISWIIKSVYDNGIRKFWNATAGKAGLGNLPNIRGIPGFSHGGVVPGRRDPRGQDDVMTHLTRGEGVLSVKDMDALGGPSGFHQLRKAIHGSVQTGQGRDGHFAPGGIIGSLVGGAKSFIGHAVKNLKKAGNAAKDLVRGSLSPIVNPVLKGFEKMVKSGGHTKPPIANVTARILPLKAIEGLISKIVADDAAHAGGGIGKASKAYKVAKAKMGKPYVFGAHGPNAFDCSGLVEYAYRKAFGMHVGMDTYAQWGHGKKVPMSQVSQGDPVFENFPGERSPGHVGLFARKGWILNAPTPGQNVQFDPIQRVVGVRKFVTDPKGANFSGNVAQWVSKAMALTHCPESWRSDIYRIIRRESGGNPRAINNYDINAKNGIPSQGLMQVIPPVFHKYHMPGTSWNIMDPVANIAAAIRYIRGRYGSIKNTPYNYYAKGGVVNGASSHTDARMRIPKKDKDRLKLYDNGGLIPPGGLALNGTKEPELAVPTKQGIDISDASLEKLAKLVSWKIGDLELSKAVARSQKNRKWIG